MKKLKVVAGALVFAMAISCFTGCKPSPDETPQETPSENAGSQGGSGSGTGSSGSQNGSGSGNNSGSDAGTPAKTGLENVEINGTEIAYSSFVAIPAGTVEGKSSNEINRYDAVFAVDGRNLTIPAFKMGAYEVTQRLYKAVMEGDENADDDPSYCKEGNSTYVYSDANADEKDLRPVEGVTWFDAVYFCNKLSEKTGKVPYYTITDPTWKDKHITAAIVEISNAQGASTGYRLPTEAEWEYAARGADQNGTGWGNYFAGKASSSTNTKNEDLDSVGWYLYNTANDGKTPDAKKSPSSGQKGNGTHRVGLKDPVSQASKLYDMSGNVWEWCYDWHDIIAADTPLSGPASSSGGFRVRRGGSWGSEAYLCSVVSRDYRIPSFCNNGLGIRVVCSAQDTSN